jgi:hypothetical protein
MKSEIRQNEIIYGNTIKARKSKRGWAIVVIPPNLRIDNFHGFPHIHFTPKGEKHSIEENDFDSIYNIIRNHLKQNKEIIKEELIKEL